MLQPLHECNSSDNGGGGRLVLVPDKGVGRHSGQLHICAAGHPTEGEAVGRADSAGRQGAARTSGQTRGPLSAVCLPVDEQPGEFIGFLYEHGLFGGYTSSQSFIFVS